MTKQCLLSITFKFLIYIINIFLRYIILMVDFSFF
jgi:hypothetical protein